MLNIACIAELARAAGRTGRSWNDWTCDDVVQDFVTNHGISDTEIKACETAYGEGFAEHRAANGALERWTTAPADYDMFGTITVEHLGEWHGRMLRRVLIEPRNVGYQESRYGSGLHPSWERDPRVEEREAQERVARIRAEQTERDASRAAALVWLRTASEGELGEAEESDTVESRGLTYGDLRVERKRRAEERADQERVAMWERCRVTFEDGAILVDDGAAAQRGRYGTIPGRDAHVYYGSRVTNDWRRVADDAEVRDVTGALVGSLQLVAEWISSGRLRVAEARDVPPEPVTRRIGHDRYREIKHIVIGADLPAKRTVWVGRPMFASAPLVLDERGHIVRARGIRDAALRACMGADTP